MTSNVFLIRCSSEDVKHIENQIKKFEEYQIPFYIIEENYNDDLIKTGFKSSNHIVVGPDFLKDNNLFKFDRVGWQCGDYVAYVAHSFFSDYDYYWIVDSDLYLNIDIQIFLEETNLIKCDCLAKDYEITDQSWIWHNSMKNDFNEIYKISYPLVRLSNRAIKLMKEERKKYHPNIKDNYYILPNDECFTATVLTNNNFVCENIEKKLPKYFEKKLFSLVTLSHVSELNNDYSKNQIIHPLWSSEKIEAKINFFLRRKDINSIIQRTYPLFCRIGEHEIKTIINIPLLSIYKKHFRVEKVLNLMDFEKELKQKKLNNIINTKYWSVDTFVLDFKIGKVKYGIDICADGSIFLVPRNLEAKSIIKNIFSNNGGKVCIVKNYDYIHKDLNLNLNRSHFENILQIILYFEILITMHHQSNLTNS
jgi:hypothetical protein